MKGGGGGGKPAHSAHSVLRFNLVSVMVDGVWVVSIIWLMGNKNVK